MATDGEVSIDPEVLAQVIGDLERTRDRIRREVAPLRHRFTTHDVPTTHLDRLTDAADRIDTVVPDLHHREQQAREIARSTPGMGRTVTLPHELTTPAQSTAYPGEGTDDFTTSRNADGSTAIRFDGGSSFAGAEVDATAEVDPPLLSIGGLKDLAGKGLSWLGDRVDDLAKLVSQAWDQLVAALTKLWEDATRWFDELSTRVGGWLDDHLDGLREWIKKHAQILRIIATILRIVGWVLVVVGVVLFVVGLVLDATGIGAIAGLPTGAAALEIANVGFLLVGLGDGLDRLVDWGEGKIDGKQLFEGLVGEAALAALSIVGLGVLGKGLQKLIEHLPASAKRKLAELGRTVLNRLRGIKEIEGRAAGLKALEHPEPGKTYVIKDPSYPGGQMTVKVNDLGEYVVDGPDAARTLRELRTAAPPGSTINLTYQGRDLKYVVEDGAVAPGSPRSLSLKTDPANGGTEFRFASEQDAAKAIQDAPPGITMKVSRNGQDTSYVLDDTGRLEVARGQGAAGRTDVPSIPPEAGDTLRYVESHNGAAPPGHRGNRPYSNEPTTKQGEARAPAFTPDGQPITYTEYDLAPKVKNVDRGGRRILVGKPDGSVWYTDDHYKTLVRLR